MLSRGSSMLVPFGRNTKVVLGAVDSVVACDDDIDSNGRGLLRLLLLFSPLKLLDSPSYTPATYAASNMVEVVLFGIACVVLGRVDAGCTLLGGAGCFACGCGI